MRTFKEWLQENKFSIYPSAYDGGNIDRLSKERIGGHSYGGRSLANWSAVNADRARIKQQSSVDQLSRDENGFSTISTGRVQAIQDLLDSKGLTIHKEAPNRFAIMDDEGNVVFHSSDWLDIERNLGQI